MKLLFLDTETTGLEPGKHGIVQISGIIDIDGEPVDVFNYRCRPFPEQLYECKALETNNLTVEKIKAFPPPEEAYNGLIKKLDKYIDRYNKNDKFYMVGQNIKFDYDHMNAWFKSHGNNFFYAYIAYHLVDLITATAFLTIAGSLKLKNMKLGTVAEYLGIEFGAHDSLEDIWATRKIFYKYINAMKGAVVL